MKGTSIAEIKRLYEDAGYRYDPRLVAMIGGERELHQKLISFKIPAEEMINVALSYMAYGEDVFRILSWNVPYHHIPHVARAMARNGEEAVRWALMYRVEERNLEEIAEAFRLCRKENVVRALRYRANPQTPRALPFSLLRKNDRLFPLPLDSVFQWVESLYDTSTTSVSLDEKHVPLLAKIYDFGHSNDEETIEHVLKGVKKEHVHEILHGILYYGLDKVYTMRKERIPPSHLFPIIESYIKQPEKTLRAIQMAKERIIRYSDVPPVASALRHGEELVREIIAEDIKGAHVAILARHVSSMREEKKRLFEIIHAAKGTRGEIIETIEETEISRVVRAYELCAERGYRMENIPSVARALANYDEEIVREAMEKGDGRYTFLLAMQRAREGNMSLAAVMNDVGSEYIAYLESGECRESLTSHAELLARVPREQRGKIAETIIREGFDAVKNAVDMGISSEFVPHIAEAIRLYGRENVEAVKRTGIAEQFIPEVAQVVKMSGTEPLESALRVAKNDEDVALLTYLIWRYGEEKVRFALSRKIPLRSLHNSILYISYYGYRAFEKNFNPDRDIFEIDFTHVHALMQKKEQWYDTVHHLASLLSAFESNSQSEPFLRVSKERVVRLLEKQYQRRSARTIFRLYNVDRIEQLATLRFIVNVTKRLYEHDHSEWIFPCRFATIHFAMLQKEREGSITLALYPTNEAEGTRFGHIDGSIAYARCYQNDGMFIIANFQRDFQAETGETRTPAYRGWDRILLLFVEEYARAHGCTSVAMTTAEYQRRKWGQLHPQTASKLYAEFPFTMGYSLRECSITIEGTPAQFLWVKELQEKEENAEKREFRARARKMKSTTEIPSRVQRRCRIAF